jgi:O-antigen/teichoic acid export membrane protein
VSARAPSGLGGGAVYALLAVAFEKAVTVGIALYLPRHLGLADYGHYALLVSYLGFFQALPDASLEAVLVARLARAPAAARALAARGAVVRLGVSLVGAVLGLGLLWAATADRALVGAGAVAAVGLAATAASPYRVWLRGLLRMGRYVALLGGQAAFGIVLLVLAVRADGGLVAVLAALTAANLGGLVLGRALVGPAGPPRVDAALARLLLAEASPLFGTTAILLGAQQVLQLLLLRLHGADEVGLLGASQRLFEAVGLLPQALMVSVLPALALAAAAARRDAVRAAGEAARVLMIGMLPPAIALVVWAEPILGAIFGPGFVAAAPVLRLLAPAAVVGASGTVVTNLLLALGLQRVVLRTTAAAAVAMLAAGAPLVRQAGARGAAAAFLAAMIAGQAALVALPATRAPVGPVLAATVRPLVLGVLAAAAALALRASPLVGAALLLLGYPAALLLTRTVTRIDLARWRA